MNPAAAGAVTAFAPAKINLYLHVLGRRPDGYHQVDSLVAFADIGDRVTAAPADALSLRISGPRAPAIAGLGEDNLVLRAARGFARRAAIAAGAALYLDKHLPVAAGVGGGSGDAAAALRALGALWRQPGDDTAMAVAAELGADVPACLLGCPLWVGGIGERLDRATLPAVGIVLANPRRPLPTAAVFAARRGPFGAPARFDPPGDAAGLARLLALRQNELTEAALKFVPEIGAVLARLALLPGALLARMSGSGATCYALFADRAAAIGAGRRLAASNPGWWTAAGALMAGPPPLRVGRGQRTGIGRHSEE